jgi:hypothetical protein
MTLRFRVLDAISLPGGTVNDDRVGATGYLAWAIDGATDVLAEPLLPGGSDAAWIAQVLDEELRQRAPASIATLPDLVLELTDLAARRFTVERRRPPAAPHEHPSAAGFIIRLDSAEIEYLSLADCQCLAKAQGDVTVSLGLDLEVAQGDRRAIEVMQTFRATARDASWREARAHLRPRMRAARDRLNTPDGYGVLSVIPPPAKFVRTGRVAAVAGMRLLLATDGLMRLVDMFGRYTGDELVDLAGRAGLAALASELREMEKADGDCVHVPRTKPHDDASAILIEIAR